MSVEPVRGCGHRKVNAMYLVGTGLSNPCDRLPFPLPEACPCCGAGIKQARGWTWVNGDKLLGGEHMVPVEPGPPDSLKANLAIAAERGGGQFIKLCPEDKCPVCRPAKLGERCGLLWVGKASYTPDSFIKEALDLGVSKRIAQVPKGLEFGKTWVLLGHPEACPPNGKVEFGQDIPEAQPGIFYAFQPTAVEKIVTESQAEDQKEMDKLEKRGITPVVVPDEDPDHR